MDNNFIWKKSDQMIYYEIYCNKYLRGIFKEIKSKPYVFYYDNISEKEIHDTAVKYYTTNEINIKDFKKKKIMKNYKLYPEFTYNPEAFEQYTRNNDVCSYDKYLYDNEEQAYFSIDDYDDINTTEIGGCYQCKKQYECGFTFSGLAFNTGFCDDKPIEYSGYIKNYGFFMCDCDNFDEIICKQPNDENDQCKIPHVEIRISLPDHEYYLLNRCILFNIKYMDKPTE